jgi:hypothetical protein
VDNEGGFVQILGNNFQCAYRYNVSINDGARVKRQNEAEAHGHVLRVFGFVGKQSPPAGPVNSYIYNNTVYVRPDICAGFEIGTTLSGVLVANNIFWIEGTARDLMEEPWKKKTYANQSPTDVFLRNNIAPIALPVGKAPVVTGASTANPGFRNPGGLDPADYLAAGEAVRGRGVRIENLPGDRVGLVSGLAVETDFFGNRVSNQSPDIGAIVHGGKTGTFSVGASRDRRAKPLQVGL